MGLGRIKREIDLALALDKAEARIEKGAKVGQLKPIIVGLGSAVIAAIVGAVTSACPDLKTQGVVIATAAVGAAVTTWMLRPQSNIHGKALLYAGLVAGGAAGLAKVTAVCPDLIKELPQILMVAVTTGLGTYLKSHREPTA